jgi:DNA-binding NarL/FixJ family response regulator
MMRVIIADDHPVVLKGLKEILQENFSGMTFDEVRRGYELINTVHQNDYNLVLLDISLPDINGIEVLKEIRKRKTRLPVLIVSMYPEEQYAIRSIKAGAQGYITKRSASEELVAAVNKILSGKRYINPAFAEQMVIDFESDTEAPPHEKLSVREMQVMKMVANGLTNKEIAEQLHLSINTVRTYRVRILEKISVRKTNELIWYAVKYGLVE